MAYSELIKSFSKIREYMTQFYVYGFKSRNEYNAKSARSYDNERRRIESWLGDYMSFHNDANGKNTFLAVDSRAISHNPLYNAFKAKSFTDNDIMLHFYILDILSDGNAKSIREIADRTTSDYLCLFDNDRALDESTIRKKLKEYERLGIIKSEKNGRELCFSRNEEWNCSAPHGAGRLMSRGTARDSLSIEEYQKEMAGIFTTCVAESTIDEAPMAYKNKDEIVSQITPTAEIISQIKPLYNFKAM